MRRSSRGTGGANGKADALADLAIRKKSGTSRVRSYNVNEVENVFDKVDEDKYASIAAGLRKEAREFLESESEGDVGLEDEFEREEEMSVFAGRGEKRKRTRAPDRAVIKRKTATVEKKRVNAAFFKGFGGAKGGDAEREKVIDHQMLDKELDGYVKAQRSARRKKKALAKDVGDMLFDAPSIAQRSVEEPLFSVPVHSEPVLPTKATEYDAPPPSLNLPVSPVPASTDSASDTVALSPPPIAKPGDCMDVDVEDAAMIAAADAVMIRAKTTRTAAATSAPIQRQPEHYPAGAVRAPVVAANAPLARDANGDVLMFWTDAHEVRVNGGEHLYLFGKVAVNSIDSGIYASVCVQVQGMERTLYVLPRKTKVDNNGFSTGEVVKIIPDVHAEVTARLLGRSVGVGGGLGRTSSSNLPSAIKAKVAVRACPFGDQDAPREPTEYLMVKFPYGNINKLYTDSFGATFKRVFGSKTSAAEALCLKRGLKGPGWIRLSGSAPLRAKVSHARYSLCISGPTCVSVAIDHANTDPPPLSTLCLNAKTVINPRSGAHELVMLAGVFVKGVPLSGPVPEGVLEPGGALGTRDFVIVRPPDGHSMPFAFADLARSAHACGGTVDVVHNEHMLLNNFLSRLMKLDPDVILGHDLMGFGLDVLIARMHARRSREWSRLGRLVQKRDLGNVVKNNASSSWFKAEAVAGRLVVDTYASAKELLMREKDYSLAALSQNILLPSAMAAGSTASVVALPSTDLASIPRAFDGADSLWGLVKECSHEARVAGRLAAHLSILPLSRQLTCISGSLWSRTLRGARAERIEFLLCHEFRLVGSKRSGSAAKAGDITAKLLLPDKLSKQERGGLATMLEVENRAARKIDLDAEGMNGVTNQGYGGAGANSGGAGNRNDNRADNGVGNAVKPKSARRKPQYSGGLVLEPKKGLYDRYVLQLDFNSLYPSIIQEFNICFTTLNLANGGSRSSNTNLDGSSTPAGEEPIPTSMSTGAGGGTSTFAVMPGRSVLEGVLPRVLRRLVEQRKEVKKLLKEERRRAGTESVRAMQLDTRQLAIKLTANSLYGCLGFEGSRFFARPIAELVTSQGRDTLENTVKLVGETSNVQVIYGDTDSLFIYTGMADILEVRKLGADLKREVNKKYRTLEIEIDAIYSKMLLLKKKKYAALKVENPAYPDRVTREVKGLDLVRHDWCDLSHEASEHFLSQIFRSQSSNIDDAVANVLAFLSELAGKVSGNEVALAKYVITKSLSKRPEEYPDGKNLPHVQVATRQMASQSKRYKPGDYIKYVICVPSSTNEDATKVLSSSDGIAMRAYHPEEVIASEGKLVIDVKYYLENQVLPPILRLADPIEGVEGSRIAIALGLDGRKYEVRDHDNNGFDSIGGSLALGPTGSEDKFRDVDLLFVTCAKCGSCAEFKGLTFSASGKGVVTSGLECAKCDARLSAANIANSITMHLRSWLKKYYCSPLVFDGCVDGSRSRSTCNVALGGGGALAKRKWDEYWLYTQLRYLHFLMNVPARHERVSAGERDKMPVSQADESIYNDLFNRVDRAFESNAFRYLDISQFLVPFGLA